MVREPRFGLVDPELEPIVEQELGRYRNGIVIDVGCGPVIGHLKNKASLVDTLIGIDNNADVVKMLEHHDIPNFVLRQADATALPFSDGSVDLAMLFGTYSDCRDDAVFERIRTGAVSSADLVSITETKREESLREIYRVMKPTGTVLVSNSIRRKPVETVKPKFDRYFEQIQVHRGPERYMMVCQYKKA